MGRAIPTEATLPAALRFVGKPRGDPGQRFVVALRPGRAAAIAPLPDGDATETMRALWRFARLFRDPAEVYWWGLTIEGEARK